MRLLPYLLLAVGEGLPRPDALRLSIETECVGADPGFPIDDPRANILLSDPTDVTFIKMESDLDNLKLRKESTKFTKSLPI